MRSFRNRDCLPLDNIRKNFNVSISFHTSLFMLKCSRDEMNIIAVCWYHTEIQYTFNSTFIMYTYSRDSIRSTLTALHTILYLKCYIWKKGISHFICIPKIYIYVSHEHGVCWDHIHNIILFYIYGYICCMLILQRIFYLVICRAIIHI